MSSNSFKKRTKSHGGSRDGAGAPRGPRRSFGGRRKRKHSVPPKATTTAKRRKQMNKNYDNNVKDNFKRTLLNKNATIKQFKQREQAVFDKLGQYFERDQIQELLDIHDLFNDERKCKEKQFNLILSLLYKSRITYKNLHETMVNTTSILWNKNRSEITGYLMSNTMMT